MKIYSFIREIFCAVIFFSAFFRTAEGGQSIAVKYPPDNTVMEFGLVSVSLTVSDGSADILKAMVNSEEKVSVVPKKDHVCFTVPLSAGINTIRISALKDNKVSDEAVLNVFRRSELESRYKNPPAGFRKDHFHMKDHPECSSCHNLIPDESDKKPVNISAFPSVNRESVSDSAGSTCYSCHRSITSYPFVHGPADVWSCLSCHEAGANPEYSVKKPDTKVCFTCHVRQKDQWYSMKYFHVPLNIGSCVICHDPHSSGSPYSLIKPVWDLCVSCHSDKSSGEHIIAGYISGKQHPTHGVPDPLRKGKELTCASCHEPHASNSPKLWRLDSGSGFELCKKCHAE